MKNTGKNFYRSAKIQFFDLLLDGQVNNLRIFRKHIKANAPQILNFANQQVFPSVVHR